jgi:hypothetical protein
VPGHPGGIAHRLGLRPGDQVLLAAVPGEDLLAACSLGVVDRAIRALGVLPPGTGDPG